ncbi:MAG TPA: hypothetical protein VFX65_08975 [Candidatus Limnocylindrales bacterium]|nr:hypothetical protein [Candidatus Limnocylindrales bacterium]
MNGRFDAELRERLERLSAAVPDLDARGDTVPIASRPGRPTWRVAGASQISAPLVLVTVVMLVGVGLLGVRGLGGPTTPAGSHGAVSATTTDGRFSLTIRAERDRYQPTDEIRIDASLVYTGPDPEITIFHGHGSPLGFGIVEPVHGLELTPGWLLSCERSIVKRDVPISRPFGKSGGFGASDPQVEEKRRFLQDPILRLPAGTWHVYAVAEFSLGDCGGEQNSLRAELTLEVDDQAAVATSTTPPTAHPTASSPPTRPPADVALAYPDGCAAYGLSERQCAFIVELAMQDAGVPENEIARIELLGDPDCVDPGGGLCNTSLGSTFLVRVRLITDGGASSEHTRRCMLGSGYPCTDDPGLAVSSPTGPNGGYWDTPCNPGPAPAGCATPMPPIDPDAAANAVALEIADLDIAIDHVGDYRIELGTATLPNGQLSEASVRSVSSEGWVVVDRFLRLTVTSEDPSRPPFETAYQHGWYPGTERVSVVLEFTVLQADPGAVLSLAGILVR